MEDTPGIAAEPSADKRWSGRAYRSVRRERLDGAPGLCYRFAPFPVEKPISMSSQPTPKSKFPKSGDEPQVVSADGTPVSDLSLEERVHLFWIENKKTILVTCAFVLAMLVGKELYFVYVDHREQAIGAEFAAAEDNTASLRAFVAAHPKHQLAGLAWLALGDAAYKEGKFVEAASAYASAIPLTALSPFAGRALVGQACSLAFSGDKAKAETSLKSIVDNATLTSAVRSEARYQLAALCAESGRAEDARKLLDEIEVTDRSGVWGHRASVLRTSLPPAPVAAQAAPTESAPALSLPGAQ